MTPRIFSLIAAAVFSLIALAHAIRLLFGWHSHHHRVLLQVSRPHIGRQHYDEYLEPQQKECERLQEKVREMKKQQQERAERRFDREMIYQALTNPHFVATNHPHQDP